jgi:hypothetical protein
MEPKLSDDKAAEYRIETAEHQLNRVDVNTLADHSLTWRSKAIRRLAVVVLLQGLSESICRTRPYGSVTY